MRTEDKTHYDWNYRHPGADIQPKRHKELSEMRQRKQGRRKKTSQCNYDKKIYIATMSR